MREVTVVRTSVTDVLTLVEVSPKIVFQVAAEELSVSATDRIYLFQISFATHGTPSASKRRVIDSSRGREA